MILIGEVERILAALILHLVDLFLDGAQVVRSACRPPSSARDPDDLAEPVLHLRLDTLRIWITALFASLGLVANLNREIELLALQVAPLTSQCGADAASPRSGYVIVRPSTVRRDLVACLGSASRTGQRCRPTATMPGKLAVGRTLQIPRESAASLPTIGRGRRATAADRRQQVHQGSSSVGRPRSAVARQGLGRGSGGRAPRQQVQGPHRFRARDRRRVRSRSTSGERPHRPRPRAIEDVDRQLLRRLLQQIRDRRSPMWIGRASAGFVEEDVSQTRRHPRRTGGAVAMSSRM